MLVAGEPSGDQLASELVHALRATCPHGTPRFFGAGGPRLAGVGAECLLDLTQHALIGLPTLGEYFKFRGFRDQLIRLAEERKPDVFIGVDYFGFNSRLAEAILKSRPPSNRPRIVQFVSPQVWASRPGRAHRMESTHDLLLSILPFERAWYQQQAPGLAVEFVGHPMVDRHNLELNTGSAIKTAPQPMSPESQVVLLLPGSRRGEIARHAPVLLEAAALIANRMIEVQFRMIVPNQELASLVEPMLTQHPQIALQLGGLNEALPSATLALASTGTVTLECAWFGVPFIALYKTSWMTYQIGKRIIAVKHLAMPNLLAGKTVAPEFIQDQATPTNLAAEAIAILTNPERQRRMKVELKAVVSTLGTPGAVTRAASAIWRLLQPPSQANTGRMTSP